MPRAVKFDRYGGIDVLRIVEVDRPVPGPEQVGKFYSASAVISVWIRMSTRRVTGTN